MTYPWQVRPLIQKLLVHMDTHKWELNMMYSDIIMYRDAPLESKYIVVWCSPVFLARVQHPEIIRFTVAEWWEVRKRWKRLILENEASSPPPVKLEDILKKEKDNVD